MKKSLFFTIVGLIVLGMTGCGNNETLSKLLGHRLSAGGTGSSAQIASTSVKLIRSLAAIGSGGGSSQSSPGVSSLKTSNSFTISGPNPDGYYTLGITGMDFSLRFRDLAGNKIIGDTQKNPEMNFMEAMGKADTSAKHLDIKGSFSADSEMAGGELSEVSFEITFTLTVVGDMDMINGGSIDYKMTGKDLDGNTFVMTATGLEFKNDKIVSGKIKVTLSSPLETVVVDITFKSNGTATGTIVSSTGYTATIVLNADGTGYYEDNSGRHTI